MDNLPVIKNKNLTKQDMDYLLAVQNDKIQILGSELWGKCQDVQCMVNEYLQILFSTI